MNGLGEDRVREIIQEELQAQQECCSDEAEDCNRLDELEALQARVNELTKENKELNDIVNNVEAFKEIFKQIEPYSTREYKYWPTRIWHEYPWSHITWRFTTNS